MKKAVIYVFSGTGNTRRAADHIAGALAAYAIEVTVCEVRAPFDRVPDPNGYDLALFGYPIHAFNTPRFFLRFVKSLPEVTDMPAYIFKTSGEPFPLNSASSRALVRLLRKKGFTPLLDCHLLMPYDIVFRYEDALAKQMALHTQDMALVIADRIANGPPQELRYNPWTVFVSYLFRIQWFGAWLNGPFIHVKKELCAGCGLCAEACPAQNVRLKGGFPRFGRNCTMCMGCAFRCPKDAVRTGILNAWRVNGPYPFEKLIEDDSVPSVAVDENTTGYFRLFWPYYKRTGEEIRTVKEWLEEERRRDVSSRPTGRGII